MPCALRRAGLVHHHGRPAAGQQVEAGERCGQLAGIAHRGRAEHIGRRGAVMGGQPVEAAEHARHVRAEHAAVGVGLVHHDVGEPGQEGGPLLMVRQQGQVQHLGIADEHRGRVAADLAPEMVAGVAVVEGGRGPGLFGPAGDQALQPGQLVLGQGLEREKIEGGPRCHADGVPAPAGCRSGSCRWPWAWPPPRNARRGCGPWPGPGGCKGRSGRVPPACAGWPRARAGGFPRTRPHARARSGGAAPAAPACPRPAGPGHIQQRP